MLLEKFSAQQNTGVCVLMASATSDGNEISEYARWLEQMLPTAPTTMC